MASLPSLPDDLLRMVEDQLSNDESSDDEEMIAFFVEKGLTGEQAAQALTYRQRYLINIYRNGFTPIRNHGVILRFNPSAGDFEPE
jgi:hypothetical protein